MKPLGPEQARRILDELVSDAGAEPDRALAPGPGDGTGDGTGGGTRSGERIAGRYTIVRELGRGGGGRVVEAFDDELQRHVALKLLTPDASFSAEARERFAREARLAARLQHPHVAAIHDATPEAIAMQLVRGTTLNRWRCDDPRQLAGLVAEACLGVHHAHTQGLIHRDLKPSNLLVEAGPPARVLVADFGLALEHRVQPTAGHSTTLRVAGTPGFLAPEQARGERAAIGPATDVWGLGATLFACLAGHAPFEGAPFEGSSPAEVLRRVAHDSPPSLAECTAGVPTDLVRIVDRCLARDPAARYASALDLAAELERFRRGEPVHARGRSPLYRLLRLAARRRAVLTSAAIAAGLALAVSIPPLLDSRARGRAAVEARQEMEALVALTADIDRAIDQARAARSAGSGHERAAPPLLQAALERCRAQLARLPLGQVHALEGRLLLELDRDAEAALAFDSAQAAGVPPPDLALLRGLANASRYRSIQPFPGQVPPPEVERIRRSALADLELAATRHADFRTAEHLYARALLPYLRGDLEAAAGDLAEVLELDLAHVDAHLTLARIHGSLRNDDLAMRHSVIAVDLMRGRRPTYVAAAGPAAANEPRPGAPLDGARMLHLAAWPEPLIDFHHELLAHPGEGPTYGMRAQVQLRAASEALVDGRRERALWHLQQAVHAYDSGLTASPEDRALAHNRAVARGVMEHLATHHPLQGLAHTLRARAAARSETPESQAR